MCAFSCQQNIYAPTETYLCESEIELPVSASYSYSNNPPSTPCSLNKRQKWKACFLRSQYSASPENGKTVFWSTGSKGAFLGSHSRCCAFFFWDATIFVERAEASPFCSPFCLQEIFCSFSPQSLNLEDYIQFIDTGAAFCRLKSSCLFWRVKQMPKYKDA